MGCPGANWTALKPICGVRDDSDEAVWLPAHFSTVRLCFGAAATIDTTGALIEGKGPLSRHGPSLPLCGGRLVPLLRSGRSHANGSNPLLSTISGPFRRPELTL